MFGVRAASVGFSDSVFGKTRSSQDAPPPISEPCDLNVTCA